MKTGTVLITGGAGYIGSHAVLACRAAGRTVVVPAYVEAPLAYCLSNTCKSRSLLQLCAGHGISSFVFSSTAAVYGGAGAPEHDNLDAILRTLLDWERRMTGGKAKGWISCRIRPEA